MSYLCIMTFWFYVTEGSRLYKRHVYNSIMPSYDTEPTYNISSWVRHLHLQQCAIVEVGDKYCGVFVEYRSLDLEANNETEEYFLGLCDLATLRKWKFCPSAVEVEHFQECIFQEYTGILNYPVRVHRRLCDVTDLAFYGELCNCSSILRGQNLYRVTGFPTCFTPHLPESLCVTGSVCGIFSCNASTVNKIHTVRCNPRCLGGQPFCESVGPVTSRASEISSYWSDWNEASCNGDPSNCTNDFVQSEAICVNKNTGMGAVDCLGPGTNCCPANAERCKCHVYMEDGILKLARELKLKPPLYQVQRNSLNSYSDVLRQHRQANIHVRRFEQFSDKNNFSKEGAFKKRNKEEYEDDDADSDDTNEEDIILEEDKKEMPMSTSPQSERSENKHTPETNKKKIAIEEMAQDLNQTETDEESKAYTSTKRVFYNILVIFGYFLSLLVNW